MSHHPIFRAASIRMRTLPTTVVLATTALALGVCRGTYSLTGNAHPEQVLSHVHGIVEDPAGEGFLLGTHEGIFTVTGGVSLVPASQTPISMRWASPLSTTRLWCPATRPKHPTRTRPPNLGIIRSADNGTTWEPTAFTGEKDFHALTAGLDGTLYGVATDASEVLTSSDGGATWQSTGASVYAMSIAADAAGRVIASTSEGLMVSTDRAVTFQEWAGAPRLVGLSSSPDHNRVVGIGSQGKIWTTTAGAQNWYEVGTAHGTTQAVTITNNGDILVVDDSGLTLVTSP